MPTPSPLSRPERLVLLAVFAVKALLSAAALFQIQSGPFGAVPILDEATYLDWAGQLAHGGWLGEGSFAQDPLYPYLLALLLKCGGGMLAARLLNACLALGALALFFCWARAALGTRAALIGAACLCLWGSLLLDEVSVGKESLVLLLCALALYAAGRAFATGGDRAWLFAGGCLGVLGLTRGNFLLIAPVLAFALGFRRHRAGLVFVAGVLLALAPIALRNLAVGGDPNPTAVSSGMNFYIGNHLRANGTYQRAPWVTRGTAFETEDYRLEASWREGRPLRPREASRYWTDEGLTFWATEPVDAVVLLVKKAQLTISSRELPNNASLLCMRRLFVPVLGFTFLGFGWLLPLAIGGSVAWLREKRPGRYAILAAALYGGTLVLTFVLERYRVPLAPFAAAGAGLIIDRAIDLGRARRWLSLAGLALPAALSAGLVWLPVDLLSPASELAQCANLVGSALTDAGDAADGLPLLRYAVQQQPADAEAQYNLGLALGFTGHLEEAEAAYAEALRLAPKHAKAHFNLALLRLNAGDADGALAELSGAGELGPRVYGPQGAAYAMKGDYALARKNLEWAVRDDWKDLASWNLLINVLVKLNLCADAKSTWAAAISVGVSPAQPDCAP